MENNKLIIWYRFFMSVLAVLIVSNTMQAQVRYEKARGKTYVFDNDKRRIYNQTNMSESSQLVATEGFDVVNYSLVAETFKNTLSAERIAELQKDMVAVSFECTADGTIKSLKFVFAGKPFLTVEEVEQLENSFLKQSFIIQSDLNKDQVIWFVIPCFFSRI